MINEILNAFVFIMMN